MLRSLLAPALVMCALTACTNNLAQTQAIGVASGAGQAELAAASTAGLGEAWVDPSHLNAEDDPALPGDLPTSSVFPDVHVVRFAQVDPALYRGGLPSKADLAAMKAHGIKTDIDTMGEVPIFDTFLVWREQRWAKEVGINFVQTKIHTGKVPFEGKITPAEADACLKVAMDPANQPCYVHCLHGRDRTGTMAAVFRMVHDHFTNDQAFTEMKSFGFNPQSYPALADFVQHYVAPQAGSAP